MPDYQGLFYPTLTRRGTYKTVSNGNYYADYIKYYNEIESDCQKRCVYCDIFLDEMGGEGMQLDHFRPKSIPEFALFKNDPNNLVLSCPKCNRLKSNHWPADISSTATYTVDCGFIDPFKEDRKNYFEIERTGEIKGKKPPSKYIIRLLKLDRMARRQVRRKRLLDAEISFVIDAVQSKIEALMDMANDISVSRDDIIQQLNILNKFFDFLKEIRLLF